MNSQEPALYAVYVGGRAPRCNTELHDVVFVVGKQLGDCVGQLKAKWFGDPARLHVDSFIRLTEVDGYRVSLSQQPQTPTGEKLFFVNLGAYREGQFTEIHENRFYVCLDKMQAKARAKAELCLNMQQTHTDDLFDVDDLFEVEVEGYRIQLTAQPGATLPLPKNGYFKLEKLKDLE